MVRSLHILTIAMFLLATGVWAFVQDPVPPSSQQNFFVDEDEDGRMDHLQIRFLGVISQDYIDEKMDSLAVNWVDSLGHALRIVVPKKDFILDTVSNRRIIIDLSDRQSGFYRLTALATPDFFIAPYGACMLYLSDGSVYTLNMKDGMAPSIVSCQLKSHRSSGVDSLKISFSEKVKTSHSCDEYLEYWSAKDSSVHPLVSSALEWNVFNNGATLIFDEALTSKERLTVKDSVRIVYSCLKDSSGNVVSKKSQFRSLDGYFPFELYKQNLVRTTEQESLDGPIFQLTFENVDAKLPNDTAWGFAVDVLGSDFESSVREILKMRAQDEFDASKVNVHFNLRIYTNLGAFVANTKYNIKGNDKRFEKSAKKLFLRWNLMDANHRRVGSGAYLANIAVLIKYDGKTVYYSENEGITTQVFGVLRR